MKKMFIAYMMIVVVAIQVTAFYNGKIVNAQEPKVIPNEAIRLRILANSNSASDQALKHHVRDQVNVSITKWVSDLTSIEQARQVIKNHLPEIRKIVAKILQDAGSNQTFQVAFNNHVKFPTKLYGNFLYPAGEYEAILITLGDGGGANWWCVLFPPLCFLDFSNGEAVKAPEPANTAPSVQETSSQDIKVENELNTPVIGGNQQQVQVRSLFVDLVQTLWNNLQY